MPTSVITDIRQQARRQDRYSVYIGGKYAFSLGELELINAAIRIGQELNHDELESLKQTAVLDKAYDRALNLIARRRRSEWELRDYLKRKDYDEAVTTEILNRLSINGYIDDGAFARAWIESRRLLKSSSKRRLAQELRQKRISDEIIQAALAEDETDELDVLRELVAKKRLQTRYRDDLKLMQYLSRQGYSYGDIKAVLSEAD